MTPMGHFSIRIHTEIAETAAECVSNDAGVCAPRPDKRMGEFDKPGGDALMRQYDVA